MSSSTTEQNTEVGADDVGADRISTVVRDHLVGSNPHALDVQVQPRDAAPNGYSNVTALFDATWTEGDQPLSAGYVVRSQVPGHELFYDTSLFFQWQMMQAIGQRSAVPVPSLVLSCDDPAVIGAQFFVMQAVPGKVPVNGTPSYHAAGWVAELTDEQRRTMSTNAVKALTQIHALDWQDGFEFLDRPDRGAPGLDQFLTYQEQWYDWVAKGRTVPLIEEALAWLRQHQPEDAAVCISWGDSRVGNMIFADDLSVAAVIDWEQASLGSPEMDVAWWLMFEDLFTVGQGAQRLEGIPDRQQLIELYQQHSGRTLSDLHYYDVLAWVRIAICVLRMYSPEASDSVASIDQPFLSTLGQLLHGD
ncbi:MAG: phosphotransferase [Ilumatobacteraceae bacterium]|nr:phosphotransferase [Ilumatobacteraceae bacterium]